MTEAYQGGGSSGQESSTAQTAKDQAASVAHGAVESGATLAGQAKAEAGEVGREAGRQVKDVLDRGRSEISEQASTQQQKLAQSVRAFGSELGTMAGAASEPGLASDLVHQVAGRADSVASWLEDREPGDLLTEVTTFARTRPGTFLAVAVGAGLVAGRLTRGVKDAPSDTGTTAGGAHRAPGAASTSSAGVPAPLPTQGEASLPTQTTGTASEATYGAPQRTSAYGAAGGVSTYGTGAATGAAGSAYGTGTALDDASSGTQSSWAAPESTGSSAGGYSGSDPLSGGYGGQGDDSPTQALPLSDALGDDRPGTSTWPSTEGAWPGTEDEKR